MRQRVPDAGEALRTEASDMLQAPIMGGRLEILERLNSQVVVQASGPIVALTANGSVLDMTTQTPETVQINVIGWQVGGITLDFTVAGAGPVGVIVQDRRLGIPKIPGVTIAPRPDWMMPAPLNDVADSTIVRRTFRF
jgi:hypothetical protein